ncbi:TipAS antibiotic-recognition domain-containing protein [Caloramator sp. Dgby_cultured_2]
MTDERFTQNIDNVKPGLAGFMSKVIKVYCDRVKK